MASISPDTPPSFHLFRSLPQEIQDGIWHEATYAVDPRVVELRIQKNKKDPSLRLWLYKSATPIPSILHACQDARAQASKRWQLSFADAETSWYRGRAAAHPAGGYSNMMARIYAEVAEPKVFFDFEGDILWFGKDFDNMGLHLASFMNDTTRGRVQRIAFNMVKTVGAFSAQFGENTEFGKIQAVAIHRDFPGLKELISMDKDRSQYLAPVCKGKLRWKTGDKAGSKAYLIPKIRENSFAEGLLWGSQEICDMGKLLEKFRAEYAKQKWVCPLLREADCVRGHLDARELQGLLDSIVSAKDEMELARWRGY